MSKDYSQPLAQRWMEAIHHTYGLSAPWQMLVRKLGEVVIDGQICCQVPEQEIASLPGAAVAVVNSTEKIPSHTPLVLDGDLLYFHRHWDYQQRLALGLWRLCCLPPLTPTHPAAMQWPEDSNQAAALRAALTSHLTIITGPPGSGKTHILKLLLQVIGEKKITFTAPTGKAARRINEVVPAPAALTIHKLLGIKQDSTMPHFHRDRRLDLQVLVVDEASMVGLKLMTWIVEALPDDAQLILLGDADQLPSVEAGPILTDMLNATPLQPHTVRLGTSYRQQGSIAQLAALVREGREDEVIRLLKSAPNDVIWILPEQLESAVNEIVHPSVEVLEQDGLTHEDCAKKFLQQLQRQRILCATNFDISRINNMVRQNFQALRNPDHGWPLLITTNGQGLANGDVGVTLNADSPTAYFLLTDSTQLSSYRRNQLSAAQSTWALTVHRSQGSEFEQVLVVLPPSKFPTMLRRSVLYTALTRARQQVTLCADEEALRLALRNDNNSAHCTGGLNSAFHRITAMRQKISTSLEGQ